LEKAAKQKVLFISIIVFIACNFLDAAVLEGVPFTEGPFSFYVATVAGSGKKGRADGIGTEARFNWPTGVSAAGDGTLYVADYSNSLIRRIDPSGSVTTLAGGSGGFKDAKGKDARFLGPNGITIDASGNLFVADADNFRIRKITPGGLATTVAGNGVAGYRDGAGGEARFGYPTGIAIDGKGVLYVADRRTHTIRKIAPGGVVTTLAGGGRAGFSDGTGEFSLLKEPVSVAASRDGILYVSDSGNNAIRKITPDGVITTLAGGKTAGYRDGAGMEASFSWPTGIAVDNNGNIYVCDSNNNKIRRITREGSTSTVAGTLLGGHSDGAGLRAGFNFPTGIALDRLGNIYVADSGNNRIRKITYGETQKAMKEPNPWQR